uniref:Uncharacterized protein n=1 Tax=Timema genevievae TaxID=629358 RepID=A0A7R9JVY7_TIMGE|nr:unnamed protein product [Timema genevievae]
MDTESKCGGSFAGTVLISGASPGNNPLVSGGGVLTLLACFPFSNGGRESRCRSPSSLGLTRNTWLRTSLRRSPPRTSSLESMSSVASMSVSRRGFDFRYEKSRIETSKTVLPVLVAAWSDATLVLCWIADDGEIETTVLTVDDGSAIEYVENRHIARFHYGS